MKKTTKTKSEFLGTSGPDEGNAGITGAGVGDGLFYGKYAGELETLSSSPCLTKTL